MRDEVHAAVPAQCVPQGEDLVGSSSERLALAGRLDDFGAPIARRLSLCRHHRPEVRSGMLEPVIAPEQLVIDRDGRDTDHALLEGGVGRAA
jgi:hypothetical protein